jgi:hypothetical protein
MKKNLTVIIPHLFSNACFSSEAAFPALRFMLSRAKQKTIVQNNLDTLLASFFSYLIAEASFPVAAITGLVDGLPTQDGYWMRADPVELQLDLSAVYFMDGEHLNLTHEEIETLRNDLNFFLQQEGMTLYTPTTTRWYLQLKENPQIKTFYSDDLIGKNISDWLPRGDRQTYFRKLMTELQMLLHGHPINQARFKSRMPLINTLWFSGEGSLPCSLKSRWKKIATNDVLVKGLAALTQTPLVESGENLLDEMEGEGDYLFVLQLPQNPFSSNKRWSETEDLSKQSDETLKIIDNNFFDRLLNSLRRGDLSKVNFYFDTQQYFQMTNKSVHFFWRRRKF